MTHDVALQEHIPIDSIPTATMANTNINGTDTSRKPQDGNGQGSVDGTHTSSQYGSLREACADINRRVSSFVTAEPGTEAIRKTQEQVRHATSVIEQALQEYGFDALSLSYNGGKDCLVLLILYLSTLHTYFTQPSARRKPAPSTNGTSINDDVTNHNYNDDNGFPKSLPSVYVTSPDPFPAMTSFVTSSSKTYHLNLTHIATNPDPSSDSKKPKVTFRDAFKIYLTTNPTITAIFVGTRRTDPHGQTLSSFQKTDGNWPLFMRVHPVLDWHLSQIWTFLRSPQLADPRTGARLEYCSMYDEGYTSLGGVKDTVRNPRLRYVDDNGTEKYKPAYEMTEDDGERLGRE